LKFKRFIALVKDN